jgi:D-2-hydroxyacid dehydrogenase (NADP+)
MAFTLLVFDEFAGQYAACLRGVRDDVTIVEATGASDALAKVRDADGLATFGNVIDDQILAAAPRLKWIQTLSSGVDSLLLLKGLKPDIVVTSAAGVHGPLVSELAMLLMLAASRRLPELIKQQVSSAWLRLPGRVLDSKTVGIAGIGAIGQQLAAKCKAFNMRVVGFGSTVRTTANVDVFHNYAELAQQAGSLDVLVLLAPLRSDTVNLVDKRIFEKMKRDSIFVNVGRGKTVNEADLIEALMTRQIGMAALDAHALEPLPSTSPLWTLENAIITPHIGGYVDDYAARVSPIIAQNLQAIVTGQVERLVNRIDLTWLF